MNLKKFAATAIMFTTATSLFMEPITTVTTVPDTVFAAGTEIVTDTEDNNSTTDIIDTTITDTDTTDISVVDSTDIESNSDNAGDSDDKITKTKVKVQIAKTKARKSYSSADLRLMSSIINCEAGIEPYQGKIAVGIVVMNRIKSKSFPNTLEGVIYQSGQFSPVRNGSLRKRLAQYDAGKIHSKQWKSCISAAKKALNGQRTIIYNGKTKNMSSYHFFSVGLRGARLSLGGHKFK